MKRKFLLLMGVMLAAASGSFAQMRYLNEVFSGVTVTPVIYDTNIWVPPFSGNPNNPGPRPQLGRVYTPQNDTLTARPVIIYLHTGSFLPAFTNQQPTGDYNDSTVVEMCTRFAKRGFVAIAINYRLGWNPATTDANVATGQLLNATYRALQDAKNAIRFARVNAAAFGIDTSKIIIGGQGTGGYATLAAATVNKHSEITLGKFIYNNSNDPNDPKNGTPFVDTTLSGNWNGVGSNVLNIGGDPNVQTNFHFQFNLGGAMGDSSWLEKGDVPMVSFHCANDPFAPYQRGNVIVPGTGTIVIQNATGGKVVIDKANRLENNAALDAKIFDDVYTTRAAVASEGTRHLFTFRFQQALALQSAPWEWWDRATVKQTQAGVIADSLATLTNPDMSAAKAKAYIDTIQGFLIPRIVVGLNLPGVETFTNTGVKEASLNQYVSVYPNPASDLLNINIDTKAGAVSSYRLVDITGRSIAQENTSNNTFAVNVNGINPGLYFVQVVFNDGNIATKRVVIK